MFRNVVVAVTANSDDADQGRVMMVVGFKRSGRWKGRVEFAVSWKRKGMLVGIVGLIV